MTVLRAGVPAPDALAQRKLERRLERAAELLCRAGVRRVLAQEGFAGWPLLEAAGLQRVSAAALCQALAAPLALAALKRQGIAPGRRRCLWRGRGSTGPCSRRPNSCAGMCVP